MDSSTLAEVEALQSTAPIWRGICRSMAADGVMPAVPAHNGVLGAAQQVYAHEAIRTREMGYATLALATALFDPVEWAAKWEQEQETKRRSHERRKQRQKQEQEAESKPEPKPDPKPDPKPEKRRVTIMADVVFVPDEPKPKPKPKPKRKANWRRPECQLPTRDEIVTAAESGLSLIEYGERLGITEYQAYKHFPRIAPGVKWNGKRRRKPQKCIVPTADEVMEAADAGFTRIEAAELFGLEMRYAYYWFPRLAPKALWLDGRAKNSAS